MACVTTASAHGETLVREEMLQSRYADWKQRFDSIMKPELEKLAVLGNLVGCGMGRIR